MKPRLTFLVLALTWCAPIGAAPAPSQAPSILPPATFEQRSQAAERARLANRNDEALRLYRQALKLRPQWPDGLFYTGALLYREQQYAKARDTLRQFVALDPRAGPGWALLGMSEFETREYPRAFDHVRQAMTLGVEGNKEMAQSLFYFVAVLLTRFELYDQSLRLLFEMARSGQAESLLVEPAGLAALRLPLLPSEIPPDRREMVRMAGEGVLAANDQRPDVAEGLFRRIVEMHPNEPGVHFLLGTFLLDVRPEEGIRELRRELEISPSDVPARVRLAEEFVKEGKPDMGLPLAEAAVKLAPQEPSAHLAYGEALAAQGKLPEAIRELERARDLGPEIEKTHWALYRAYNAAGLSEKASQEKAAIEKLLQPAAQP